MALGPRSPDESRKRREFCLCLFTAEFWYPTPLRACLLRARDKKNVLREHNFFQTQLVPPIFKCPLIYWFFRQTRANVHTTLTYTQFKESKGRARKGSWNPNEKEDKALKRETLVKRKHDPGQERSLEKRKTKYFFCSVRREIFQRSEKNTWQNCSS